MASPNTDGASALALDDDSSPRTHDAPRVSRAARLGIPLSGEWLPAARALVNAKGLTEAARLLGTSRNTMAAAAGGAGLREGTRLLFEQRLRALQTEIDSPRRGAR
jgi:hypothetical protein